MITKLQLTACVFTSFALIFTACKKDTTSSNYSTTTTSTKTTSTTATTSSTATSSTTSSPPIVNTWLKRIQGISVIIEFQSNNTYFVSFLGSPSPEEAGTYSLSGSTVILNANTGDCKNKQGKYSYTIANNVLTFTAVNDSCTKRISSLSGEWAK